MASSGGLSKPFEGPPSLMAPSLIPSTLSYELDYTGQLSPPRQEPNRVCSFEDSISIFGLPPTEEEIEDFIQQEAPDAYDRLVDRLLASPRYGERWARHWLDAAHFAETHGHDQDRIRENAWPYRDYLITSLNQDKPYGQMVKEQLAADVFSIDNPGDHCCAWVPRCRPLG